jgi:uncharacterized protein YqjF (DUF2071 family)
MSQSSRFLTAEWRQLAMLNYQVDPDVLREQLPRGTELDDHRGRHFVSVVGFLFLHTKVRGLPIPFHRDFEEVNLRFYVRREEQGELRRGVVFIKEIVPRRAIAWVARTVYNENYVALPMRHRIAPAERAHPPTAVRYGWRNAGRWEELSIEPELEPADAGPDSEERFITEHYWGYARQRDGGTVEYRVEHPPWSVWRARQASLDADVERLYGARFVSLLRGPPASAFLADGSTVAVHAGRRLP